MRNMDQEKLERAEKRVKEIKGFYTHLLVYIVINCLLLFIQLYQFDFRFDDIKITIFGYFSTPFFWGIGLLFHGLYVFQHKFKAFKNWEERKIKEYMQKEEEEYKNTTHWD
ncbi:MAG: 2TM domain-containing protein [Bacteroidota bacterium]